MKCKKRKNWNVPPEEEQKGLLFWFQILQKHYLTLFYANALTVVSLLPFGYFAYLLTQTRDLVFWVLALGFWVVASPMQTALQGTCTRLVHRRPVWIWEDLKTVWKQEWKTSMLFGLLTGILWSALAYSIWLILAVDGGLSVGHALLFALVAYLLTGLTFFGFQQIAMVELPLATAVKNAVLLIFAGKLRSFFVVLILWGMVLLPVIYYGLAAYILLMGWLAFGVMTAELMFAPVFQRLFLAEEDT